VRERMEREAVPEKGAKIHGHAANSLFTPSP